MLTSAVNSLVDRLLSAYPPTRSYGISDFSGDPMPVPVRDYLRQELRARLGRVVPEPEAWIDDEHDDVARAQRAYLDVLARHQRVPAHAWEGILDRACDETMRVLVRPASTLADLVFEDGRATAAPDEVLGKLDYFSFYPYFREVVEAYVEQKNVASFDRSRLEALLKRVDREMTSDYGPAEWVRLLRPLSSVLRAAGFRDEIPSDLLAAFLHEKGAEAALNRLHNGFESDERVPTDALAGLFRPDAGDGAAAGRPQRPEPVQEDRSPTEREPIPLWKQFEQSEVVIKDEHVAQSARSGPGEPLWKQFRGASDTAQTVRSPHRTMTNARFEDLEMEVLGPRGARNRELFIRHLFAGDRNEYESTVRKLQSIGTWAEASKVIAQEVFLKHQVNIYSDPAVAFTDAAEMRYRR